MASIVAPFIVEININEQRLKCLFCLKVFKVSFHNFAICGIICEFSGNN